MIIKGLFRRYERWNPVHPTCGAFWGMGVGIGCGVGWGPGFGPEVIGYVGAGCGVGFSVGITLAGFGIGLPANFIFEVPYNAVMAMRSGALGFAQSRGLISSKDTTWDGRNIIAPHISTFQREARVKFSSFWPKATPDEGAPLFDTKDTFSVHTRSIGNYFGTLRARLLHPRKGLKD